MTEQFPESVVAKAIGAPIGVALGTLIGAPMALLSILGGHLWPAFSLIYQRYIGVLGEGAKRKGSPERQAYDALRESLVEGGSAARLYARLLTHFLDAVDHFFGDAGMADRALFPRAFGLRTPASLWTAPAFDRCLFLALLYPVVMIFVIWAVSGHVGRAEAALHLGLDLSAWQRGLTAAAVGLSVFVFWAPWWRLFRAKGRTSVAWWLAVTFAVTLAFAIGTTALSKFAAALASCLAGVRLTGVGAVSIAFFMVGLAASAAGVGVVAMSLVVAVMLLNATTITCLRQGVFLSLFLPAMIVACLVEANLLASLQYWGEVVGHMLLFLGLLTLLNAPFDWASLGLTRALLRRGLDLAGWWPYVLALVDALLAAVIVAVLAVAMVIGVQVYDGLAVHGGGAPVLPIDKLFNGIAAPPTGPEYWWIYALLLSTMIPSLINLNSI